MKGDRNLSFQTLSLQIDGQLFMSAPANPDTRDEWRVQSGDVTLRLFILPRFSPGWFGGTEEKLGSCGQRGCRLSSEADEEDRLRSFEGSLVSPSPLSRNAPTNNRSLLLDFHQLIRHPGSRSDVPSILMCQANTCGPFVLVNWGRAEHCGSLRICQLWHRLSAVNGSHRAVLLKRLFHYPERGWCDFGPVALSLTPSAARPKIIVHSLKMF
ncbi:hypothetical protein QQF64_025534 [Cirrhinus molitorella]|uniref:Uncharacterized protein n=1 Tax=Cirrhinus molitorella TaxID=172907 RepID=A0ABR3NPA3_9TELE